jgi:succinyl-CoA synthetase beta subunit
MHVHEYQAKNLLTRYGIPIPPFVIATNKEEVLRGIQELGLKDAVLKIQVHAGGRGKAGGVKFAKDPDEILLLANELIGMRIINEQTGPEGVVAQKILITPALQIKKEYYLAAVIDRSRARPCLILSAEGGMEIEEIALKNPEAILKLPFSLDGKVRGYQLLSIAKFMKWEGNIKEKGCTIISNFAQAFIESDGSLLEINPLVETENGDLFAVDAKFTLDDNALFRQPWIEQWYDASQLSKSEALAKQYELSYVKLDGDIGCMVNGAGLAMATMDLIYHLGGRPANFLDVGGGSSIEKIAHGFKIIQMDKQVKSIFVNIFGGIMDCSVLAKGIIEATTQEQLKIPLVVRMEGTNVDEGKKLLESFGVNLITASDFAEGASKAIHAARGH